MSRPFFPKSHGEPRVNDRKVLSGIIFINRNGLRWRDAPIDYGPHKTLYNGWKRWPDKGIFSRILVELAKAGDDTDTLAIDATHLKAHRTAASLGLKKGGRPPDRPNERRTQYQLHAVVDHLGRPIRPLLTAGQVSNYVGARQLLDVLPPAKHMLADRG